VCDNNLAACLARLLPCLGEYREEDRRQNGDDGDHDQQLDEREAPWSDISGLHLSVSCTGEFRRSFVAADWIQWFPEPPPGVLDNEWWARPVRRSIGRAPRFAASNKLEPRASSDYGSSRAARATLSGACMTLAMLASAPRTPSRSPADQSPSLFRHSSRMTTVALAPTRVTPRARTSRSASRVRTPPAAFTWTCAGECWRISSRSSCVAPPVP